MLLVLPQKVIYALFAAKKRHFSYLKCLFFAVFSLFSLITPVIADDACLSAEQQLSAVDDWVKVSKVIDGDTLHLQDGRKVRLIGINAPELGRRGKASQPFARKAYHALSSLLKNNKKIGLSYDKDKKDPYKRLLAYIILMDGRSVERILLSKGLVHSIVVPPNDSRINCYRKIEKNARDANLGLWQLSDNQWIEASHLSPKSKGPRYVSGTVSAYNESKRSIYLKLNSRLSIRIAKKDRKYFPNVSFNKLIGKHLQVRGWVSTYRGRQSIHVRTSHDLHIIY